MPESVLADRISRIFLTLALGAAGGVAAIWVGLPAGGLLGATLAVSAASLVRLRTEVPSGLRNMAFAAIGCSLGSGVDGELLALAVTWPLSLIGLVVTMSGIVASGYWLLVCRYQLSRETALLATSPGALSYSLALAASGIGDAKVIAAIQSVRLLLITTALPLVLDLLELPHGRGSDSGQQVLIGTGVMLGIFLVTLVCGYLLDTSRLPAAFLIAGVLVSGTLHLSGSVAGRPPQWFLVSGFVVTGSVVGARFSSISMADLRRLLSVSLAVVVVSTGLAAMAAALAARLLDLPFGQVWVAYAPGGVEAMAAMALALEYDPTYVAAHHLVRILLLIMVLPMLIRLIRRFEAISITRG